MEFENNCAQQPDHETRHAIKEISRNGTTDAYFKARAPLIDTLQNRRTFEAGFDRGWNAALRNEPEAPIRTVKPQNEEEGNSASEGFEVECRAPEHPAISDEELNKLILAVANKNYAVGAYDAQAGDEPGNMRAILSDKATKAEEDLLSYIRALIGQITKAEQPTDSTLCDHDFIPDEYSPGEVFCTKCFQRGAT